MRDYSKAKIYKIECNVTNDVYYGSTTSSLSERMRKHKDRRNCSSINIIDRGNYSVKVIEEYPCNSKHELETRERWYIENNVCINKHIPTRTRQEWCEDNKVYIAQKAKEYNENNKVELVAKKKKYYEKNKDEIAQKTKEYREANKVEINEYSKQYRENNKDILKAKQNEKLTCDCGGKYTRSNYLTHCRTKKHQDYLLITLT